MVKIINILERIHKKASITAIFKEIKEITED